MHALWGRQVADTLLPVKHREGLLEVTGFAQRPAQAKPADDGSFETNDNLVNLIWHNSVETAQDMISAPVRLDTRGCQLSVDFGDNLIYRLCKASQGSNRRHAAIVHQPEDGPKQHGEEYYRRHDRSRSQDVRGPIEGIAKRLSSFAVCNRRRLWLGHRADDLGRRYRHTHHVAGADWKHAHCQCYEHKFARTESLPL